jgi:hypothetical protein
VPTAPTTELARPNGPVLVAARRDTPPNIDAQADDWPDPLPYAIEHNVYRPEQWSGTDDQSGRFAAAWDANNLYLLVDVADDTHVQNATGELLYRGDSLELQFDADLAGDFTDARLNGDDHQLGLSPGPNREAAELYLWNPVGKRGVPGAVSVAVRPDGDQGGYVLEVAIPWPLLGVTPASGSRYGFALNSSDNDSPGTSEQQSMISSVPSRTLLDPTTWGTLALE